VEHKALRLMWFGRAKGSGALALLGLMAFTVTSALFPSWHPLLYVALALGGLSAAALIFAGWSFHMAQWHFAAEQVTPAGATSSPSA
jgi:hypothetical protein